MLTQKKRIDVSKLILLAAFSATFLFLYVLLSYHNRLAADDFYFFKNLNRFGIWDGMLVAYHSWVTRWFAILFLNVALGSYNLFHSLLPYHLITLVALICAVMNFIRILTEKFLNAKFSSVTLFLFSVPFTSSFFFFTFNIGETWFWITCTAMYLWSIILFIVGFTFILRAKNTVWSKLICSVCFLFIGGASESTAISIFILLIALLLYFFYKNNFSFRIFRNDVQNKLLLISIASILVSLFISYVGEGRVLRQSALPETGILSAKFIAAKSLVKLVLFYLPLKIHWFIFFFVPWIYLGSLFSSEEKRPLEKVIKKLVVFFAVFLLLSFISFIPISFLLGEAGPFRTWILVSFYLSIYCAGSGFYLGSKIDWNKKTVHRTFFISLYTLIVLMCINIIEQNKITSEYAAALDDRMSYLEQSKERMEKNTITVNALPPSGMLYSSDISEDSSHFSNQHLKNFLELTFDIKKK